ncbi:hypothetical protein AVEN_273454-1 [Araneus ventricosus]|uniref:Uncharacterized protein n=1 Tax=Araneus ventricosus TaxID=182803 RepID=A0A4Y2VIB6_ARAVE|nr:hypothetical protein AVEN_273454-1 [Araneus ventricosus]
MKEELETLLNQYLDIEEASIKSDEEMMAIEEERDEIEVRVKCLLSKHNVNLTEIIENKSNQNSDSKSYIGLIALKSKLPEILLTLS